MNDYIDIVIDDHYYPVDENDADGEMQIAQWKSLEAPLFTAFVKHVCRGGTEPVVRKSIYEDENGKLYKTNLQTVRNIKALSARIDEITKDLGDLQESIHAFVPCEKPELVLDYDEDYDDLTRFVDGLRHGKDQLRDYYNSYNRLLRWKRRALYLNDNLDNANLQMRLYKRTMAFDITEINYLPEDMEWYIGQFLGKEFKGLVRKRCITYRYFPVAHDSLSLLLNKWTIAELKRYLEHVYLQYVVIKDDVLDLEIIHSGRIPKKKNELIVRILQGDCKCSFYELQRDVFLLTKIRKAYKQQARADKRKPV
jgi:hypothetical protein